jgi:hypothetical protein
MQSFEGTREYPLSFYSCCFFFSALLKEKVAVAIKRGITVLLQIDHTQLPRRRVGEGGGGGGEHVKKLLVESPCSSASMAEEEKTPRTHTRTKHNQKKNTHTQHK